MKTIEDDMREILEASMMKDMNEKNRELLLCIGYAMTGMMKLGLIEPGPRMIEIMVRRAKK